MLAQNTRPNSNSIRQKGKLPLEIITHIWYNMVHYLNEKSFLWLLSMFSILKIYKLSVIQSQMDTQAAKKFSIQ